MKQSTNSSTKNCLEKAYSSIGETGRQDQNRGFRSIMSNTAAQRQGNKTHNNSLRNLAQNNSRGEKANDETSKDLRPKMWFNTQLKSNKKRSYFLLSFCFLIGVINGDVRDAVPGVVNANKQQEERDTSDYEQGLLWVCSDQNACQQKQRVSQKRQY